MMKRALAIASITLALGGVASGDEAEKPPTHPIVTDLHGPGGEAHGAAPGHGEHGGAAAEHGHGDPSRQFNWTGHIAPFGSSSYKSVDQQGNSLEPGEEAMSVPFVLVLINFGIILLILGWKVAPMARQMAEKRSDDIKGALDEAARLRDEAKRKLAEYSSKLKQADTEIDTLIKDMRSDAEAERKRIIAAAEAQAADLKKDADERIRAEIERANVILQREVVLAATAVAEQLLRSKTTPADQAKLVDTFLGNVAAAAHDARGRT